MDGLGLRCGVLFQNFGLVVDVFVPKKKSRDGKESGFVRYRGVNNPDTLVTKIRNVKLEQRC